MSEASHTRTTMSPGGPSLGDGEPRSLTDLAVLRAVYRPGPMAYGTPALLVRREREGDAAVRVHLGVDAALTDLLR
jgi:DNA polymerase III alpha subunit